MSLPLFHHLSSIAERLAAAQYWLLGLDYDGTLTPLASMPSHATLAPGMRTLLQSFVDRGAFSTAIVSGRGLDELRSMVGVDRLIYAGNHGLEIRGPEAQFVDALAVEKRAALAELSKRLITKLRGIAGADVENKRLTVSVHYRLVAPYLISEVQQIAGELVANDVHGFHITHGKMVLEIRPSRHWHKGNAIDWIRRSATQPPPLTFYIGDDLTDEDAFQALSDDITIKVGGDFGTTAARYYVDSPAAVATFLHWLDHVSKRIVLSAGKP